MANYVDGNLFKTNYFCGFINAVLQSNHLTINEFKSN